MKKIFFLLMSAIVTFCASADIYVVGGSGGNLGYPDKPQGMKVTATNGYYVFQVTGENWVKISTSSSHTWDQNSGTDTEYFNDHLIKCDKFGNDNNGVKTANISNDGSITQLDNGHFENGTYKWVRIDENLTKIELCKNYPGSSNAPANLYFFDGAKETSTAFEVNGDTFTYTVDATDATVYGAFVTGNVSNWGGAHGVNAYFPADYEDKSGNHEINGETTWGSLSLWNPGWDNTTLQFNQGKIYTVTLTFKNDGISGAVTATTPTPVTPPTPETKTLYIAYANISGGDFQTGTNIHIEEATSTTEATEGGKQVTKYNFVVPINNNDRLRWKFVTSESASLTTKNADLFAPDENRMPIGRPVKADADAAYWYLTPNYDGYATVTAWFTNEAQTEINLSYKVTYYERPRQDNFFYSINGGNTWIMITNRITVEGEYTQWSVTIPGQEGVVVKFRLNNEDYKVASNNELGTDDNHLFTTFSPDSGDEFKFKGAYTYQFLIRHFEKHENIEYPYEVAARKVTRDSNFTEFGFNGNNTHYEDYSMTAIESSITNLQAASPFKAYMAYDDGSGNMTLTPGVDETLTTEVHWVKYEHPFWGAPAAASMQYKDPNQSVEFALWWSDTYLHPNDPRVKTWFPDKVDQLDRRNSIDKVTDLSFKPQTNTSSIVHTYYRAYITMKRVLVDPVDPVQPADGPQRAVVNSQFAGNYGTRVAFAAPLPESVTTDIVSGVEEVSAEPAAEFDGEAEYFTISGLRVYGTPAPGLYIVRRGNVVTKEIVK